MAGRKATLLSLPQDIHEIIFDHLFEDDSYSNLLTMKTAYTPATCPILYAYDGFSTSVQRRLYKNHAIVIPIQQPHDYISEEIEFSSFLPHCSKRMKAETTTLVVEVDGVMPPESEEMDEDEMEDYARKEESPDMEIFAQKLVEDLLNMKAQLPKVTTIRFIFWCGAWIPAVNSWVQPLLKLQEQWKNIGIDFHLHTFDYDDPDAGDGGYNSLQGWQYAMDGDGDNRPFENVNYLVVDFPEEAKQSREWRGRWLDPRLWDELVDDDDFTYGGYKVRYEALRWGVIEAPPFYVRVGEKADED